ncbi:MAG: response regulator [Chthoniobacteraceae bacterium]
MKTDPTNSEVEILIVEDSLTQAEQLKYTLEQHGYRHSVARNGREALDSIGLRGPTLVISDVMMPEMDGYELCHRIKSDEKLKKIPVILLTSLSDPTEVVKGLESGADSFIFKPYDADYLLARVAYILANRHLRESESHQMGVEIFFAGRKFFITSDRLQILNLLLSTYEAAIQKNKELTATQDKLRHLNETLELANKELEAFSYSVSHDLRAPLRHIDGFSKVLLMSYLDQLPAKAQSLLQSVSERTKYMGQLIDELLNFSRLARQPVGKHRVILADLVQQALDELVPEQKDREVEVRTGDLPDCVGDAVLLKQVLINLLSNAFKFTRKKEHALIEIGSGPGDKPGEVLYFVRDNGAGFDMEYATKLFGVFQRMHRATEFEGTGVGLSIVQRIIHRHGGRIWAEAKVDHGAAFYFTLPQCAPETPVKN